MTNEITIYDIKVPTKREEVCNRDNINKLLENIEGLRNNVLKFDTKEDIKESKAFKTNANKFIKEFKEFCDPLEEEGRIIAKTRSEVKLTLEKIVEEKLAPIVEREEKLKVIKDNLFIPSLNIDSCVAKKTNLILLDNYDWFGLKDEALPLINQSITFLDNELLGFEKAAKEKLEAEEKQRLERENLIKEQAKLEAEKAAANAIAEANRRAEQAEAEARRKVEQEARDKAIADAKAKAEEELKAKNKDHQAKIHNEILTDLDFYVGDAELKKEIVRAIAGGKIRNLKIIY
jgi:hypothetical protein